MKNPWFNIFKKPPIRKALNDSCVIRPLTSVVASLQEPGLLKSLVEKLALRDEIDSESDPDTSDWQPVSTSSLEGYALGDLVLENDEDLVNSLFDTCFLFTCVREKKMNYSLTWISSLS